MSNESPNRAIDTRAIEFARIFASQRRTGISSARTGRQTGEEQARNPSVGGRLSINILTIPDLSPPCLEAVAFRERGQGRILHLRGLSPQPREKSEELSVRELRQRSFRRRNEGAEEKFEKEF
ncbi:hypothetical protein AcW1_003557 [Taiwanofungus camphoratus]|nr:hypothetical protein AcW1_003557 [Antrodia cinnamomea]